MCSPRFTALAAALFAASNDDDDDDDDDNDNDNDDDGNANDADFMAGFDLGSGVAVAMNLPKEML